MAVRFLFVLTSFLSVSVFAESSLSQILKRGAEQPRAEVEEADFSHGTPTASPAASGTGRPVNADSQKKRDEDLRRLFDSPGEFLDKEGKGFLQAIADEKPELIKKVEQVVSDYRNAHDAFLRFKRDNIDGKNPDAIAKEAFAELRKRSREIRDLETSLRLLISAEDLASLVRDFKRNPLLFLREEGDRLVQRVREKDPERAKEFESVMNKYRDQARELEKDIRAKMEGKTAEEIAEVIRQELRGRSESLARLDDRMTEILEDVAGIKNTVEREIRDRDLGGKLRGAEQEFNRAKDEELRKIDGERKKVEEDLRKLLQIGQRRQ